MRPDRLNGAINGNKSNAATCMVIGCTRIAIYRNANSAATGVQRGYCSRHKSLAVTSYTDFGSQWKPDRPTDDPWIPICSDDDKDSRN